MASDVYSALSERNIENRRLSLSGFTEEQKNDCVTMIRNAILLCELPHVKVIGIDVKFKGATSQIDYVTKMYGIGESYVELMLSTSELIMSVCAGRTSNPEDNEFFLKPNVGCLMAMGEVTSSNGAIMIEGGGFAPDTLIPNIKIASMQSSGCVLHFATMEGKGFSDFDRVQSILSGTNFKPVRVSYDLNNILSVKTYTTGDEAIVFNYKRQVNETVLSAIVSKYLKLSSGGTV